jgi:hypothetical protein
LNYFLYINGIYNLNNFTTFFIKKKHLCVKKNTFCYFFENKELISKIKLQFLSKTLATFNDISLKVYFVINDYNMTIFYINGVIYILNKDYSF